jgi:hypothetical protein
MFDTICDLIPVDPDYPERSRVLDVLSRVLNGTLYDVLPFRFHDERGPNGEYIPLRNRRPSVRYPLCKIVVEDGVSLLFSEGHFPLVECSDPNARTILADIIKETKLTLVMMDAAVRGSVGSVAVLMRVLSGRLFFDVLDTIYLTPSWDENEPDTLALVTEKYKVSGQTLQENGYSIEDPGAEYWFCRQWDKDYERWYLPAAVGQVAEMAVDERRTVRHALGFVPLVWIRNLPGVSATRSPNEGACTFRSAVETQIEIDYQLSQAGRGLKYSSDPTLLLKEPTLDPGDVIKGAGNALVVSEKGDARLLEIGGTASAAVIEYVRTLREFALEAVHGNRSSPDRLTAAQSGKALELMNHGLLCLADTLRITYGDAGLLPLLGLVVRASQKYSLKVMGVDVGSIDPAGPLSLKWPSWYPSSADDRQKDAQTLSVLTTSSLMSKESAIKSVCNEYDIADPFDEILRIEKQISGTEQ